LSENHVAALRAVLRKEGTDKVQFELHRTGPSEFEMVENGCVVGMCFKNMDLREVWEKCIAGRYAGYAMAEVEEWVPE
jgi:hypothetical protein